MSGKVYDVTEFLSEHPGGSSILLKHAGRDATAAYEVAHGPEMIEEGLPVSKKMGPVDPSTIESHPPAAVAEKPSAPKPKRTPLSQIINLHDFEVGSLGCRKGPYVRTPYVIVTGECKGQP